MISAFALALRQLADPRVVAIMLKCVGIAFLAFAVIGTVSWYALDMVLAAFGFEDNLGESAGAVRGLAALVIILIGGWLLWRIIALAVLQIVAMFDVAVAASPPASALTPPLPAGAGLLQPSAQPTTNKASTPTPFFVIFIASTLSSATVRS